MQLSMSRMEKEQGRREDVLRQEISDLQQVMLILPLTLLHHESYLLLNGHLCNINAEIARSWKQESGADAKRFCWWVHPSSFPDFVWFAIIHGKLALSL